ncbi:MAG: hypothetical protein QNJ08_00300, partial [Crocosphaera sp.]|nr:hypothetical protein [Crocosphaera sp.]
MANNLNFIDDMTLNGILWQSGLLTSPNSEVTTITQIGDLTINNGSGKRIDGQLNNEGNINHISFQDVSLLFGALINNIGNYDLNGIIFSSYTSGGFNNLGILNITQLGGSIDAVFNNSGTVNIDPGSRLTLGGEGISDNGIFNLGDGSTFLYDAGNSDIFNGNTYTVTNNSQITGNGELNINSGIINLELSQGADIDVNLLTIRAGTLNVDQDFILPETTTIIGDISGRVLGHLNIEGNLTLSPTTVWQAGIIESSGMITNNGLLELQPWFTALNEFNPRKILTGQLDNHGIITHEDGLFDFLELTFGSILNNFNEYELNGLIRSNNRTSAFNNEAILNVVNTGGGFIDAVFNNTGTVNIDPGSRLILGADGVSNEGIFNLGNGSIFKYDGGAKSRFDNGNTYTLTKNSQINGMGELLLESGFLNFNISQGASIADTIILTLNRDGTFNIDDDWTLVTVTNWNGGTLQTSGIITNNGTLNIGNVDRKNIEGQLDNHGTIIHNNSTGQDVRLNFGAVINNLGNYELNGTLVSSYMSSELNNSGILNVTEFGGSIDTFFNNSGTVNLESASRLHLGGSGISNNGIFNLGDESTLLYDAGNSNILNGNIYTFTNNSQINGTGEFIVESGVFNLELSQGASIADTIILTLNRDITFNIDDDWTLLPVTNWNGGMLQTSGVLTNNGTLNIGNREQKNLDGQLDNYGTIIHNNSTSRSVWLNSSAVINNFANYELFGTISSGYDSSIFNNSGELSGQGIIGVTVNNSGHINVGNFNNSQVGRLTIDGNYLETDSSFLNFELGGYNSGTQYDKLDINGLARFDGTLNISLINGFLPVLGDSFDLITYDELHSVSELNFTGLTIDSDYEFSPEFSNNKLTLTVVEKTNNNPISLDIDGNGRLEQQDFNLIELYGTQLDEREFDFLVNNFSNDLMGENATRPDTDSILSYLNEAAD